MPRRAGRPVRQVSEEEVLEILTDFQNGLSRNHIATRHHMGRDRVSKILHDHNLLAIITRVEPTEQNLVVENIAG